MTQDHHFVFPAFPDLDHICLVESLLFATFVFLALITTGLEKLISGLSPDDQREPKRG